MSMLPLAVILGFLFVFTLLFAGIAIFRVRRDSDVPGCSSCGYARKGLETSYCPECGSPWNTGSRRPRIALIDLLMMSGLLVVPVVIMSWFIYVILRYYR